MQREFKEILSQGEQASIALTVNTFATETQIIGNDPVASTIFDFDNALCAEATQNKDSFFYHSKSEQSLVKPKISDQLEMN